MTLIPEELREELLKQVLDRIRENLPIGQAQQLMPFTRAVYSSVAPEDIASKSVIDLYGAIISLWRCINPRKPHETKVNVYNPQFEQHGWQTTHTVIEIVCDDMPFLVESVRMAINRRGLAVHLILHVGSLHFARDKNGTIQTQDNNGNDRLKEAAILLEVDRQSDSTVLDVIKQSVEWVLEDVRLCVEDWQAMTQKMAGLIKTLANCGSGESKEEKQEKIEFLKWLNDNHFTYLGYCQVDYVKTNAEREWIVSKESALGIFRRNIQNILQPFSALSEQAQQMALSEEIVILGKADTPATVHRPAYPDFISVKIFDTKGTVIGEHRFIGLYTSAAYNWSVANIPLVRDRVQKVLQRANLSPQGHDAKSLLNILETLPRDELFQATDEELFRLATGVLYMQERQQVRVFLRKDRFGKFYSCLVYVPRDRFHSQLRENMQAILKEELDAVEVEFTTHFSESVLARIYFIARLATHVTKIYDLEYLQKSILEATRTWQDNFRDVLIEHYGEEQGNEFYERYGNAFPAGYREQHLTRTAVFDVHHLENLTNGSSLEMNFYRPLEEAEGTLRLKLYHPTESLPLSDIIPMLECMGLRVISEDPHEITTKSGKVYWINDFGMYHRLGQNLNVDQMKDIFQDAFYNVWVGNAESDGFNRLVLEAGLNWREVIIMRAYAKYLWQIGFSFSQAYIENTLADNAKIAKLLVDLFVLRFDPTLELDNKGDRV
ncbi:MAG TPA: NAD-glutamate dehydrogenase, partial [Gammaproteobacteria bacterium]|nr:NAD-glutamate dehydrogenase [Gammaproteobacteria bacterium]